MDDWAGTIRDGNETNLAYIYKGQEAEECHETSRLERTQIIEVDGFLFCLTTTYRWELEMNSNP